LADGEGFDCDGVCLGVHLVSVVAVVTPRKPRALATGRGGKVRGFPALTKT
jgi:hypothetical protein